MIAQLANDAGYSDKRVATVRRELDRLRADLGRTASRKKRLTYTQTLHFQYAAILLPLALLYLLFMLRPLISASPQVATQVSTSDHIKNSLPTRRFVSECAGHSATRITLPPSMTIRDFSRRASIACEGPIWIVGDGQELFSSSDTRLLLIATKFSIHVLRPRLQLHLPCSLSELQRIAELQQPSHELIPPPANTCDPIEAIMSYCKVQIEVADHIPVQLVFGSVEATLSQKSSALGFVLAAVRVYNDHTALLYPPFHESTTEPEAVVSFTIQVKTKNVAR